MVCWVEPSAQNSIYISNNPSHKKSAELNSYLLWPARNLRVLTWRLRGLSDLTVFVGDGRGIYTHPFALQWSSSTSLTQTRTEALSLPSLMLPTPLLKSL